MIIGLGTDVAEVGRFKFAPDKLARFARKVFTPEEMAHAMRHRHFAERLAGAFAAKEATRKAFGHAIPWRLVGVRHERSGKPYVALSGGAERLTTARRVSRMHLSISHSRTSAVATVILEADEAVAVPRPVAVDTAVAR
ncbi:MAG: holo-ACP synthase [Candidatus Eremiobacteraeota bacterium]|nr:holo-ACP synthase [Candidatus Eremiobacteraeota bacterium]MBV8223308.1 holo-ACP synthase [Candidatus Eremiobacteraeota bacterium]MBV8280948.1 holo-ACP synthase [Candidatus Eremiobacteraeota bacterium]